MKSITELGRGAIILGFMLFLLAFARFIPLPVEHDDLDDEPRAVLGHTGLTVIALVFVLLTFWKS